MIFEVERKLSSFSRSLELLRELVSEVDKRVEAVASCVFQAGLELVVIGGGHNNCYPIMRAAAHHYSSHQWPNECRFVRTLDIVNLDPHADCRNSAEGRHSGNGFSTAFEEGLIRRYFLCGYHNRYNSQATMDFMRSNEARIRAASFEGWLDRGSISAGLEASLHDTVDFFRQGDAKEEYPRGIELCLDAIRDMPASASTPSGVCLDDARRYARFLASHLGRRVAYLHLAEGAPGLGPGESGKRTVGKALAYLCSDFLECRSKARVSC